MAIQVINIGTSANKGDGEPLRTAFDKINDNFAELSLKVTNLETGTVTTGDTKGSVFGDDSTLLVDGVNSTIPSANLSGALPAIDGSALTGITTSTFGGQTASYYLDYNNFTNTPTLFSGAFADLTGKPTTLSGYGISDAYTKTEVDSAISSSVLTSGSTHSIDIVAADSTLLVDSVNGTLNATTLTGALPAIDGSALTGITATTLGGQNASYYLDYNNFTNTPTIPSAYTDGNVDVHLNQSTAGPNQVLSWNGSDYAWVAQSGGGGGTVDIQGSVFADDSTLLVDGVNGTINSSALTKPIALADNEKIIFGDDDNLEIFHNSSNGNTIIDNNTGNLVIKGSNLFLQSASSEYFFRGAANGAVTLYYDNVAKFETTADGISVTDHIALPDNGELRLGTDNDMQISHSGVSGLIKSTTGTLALQGSTVRIQDGGSSQTAFSASNGIATLLFENSAKLVTTTNGVTITGDTTVSGNLTAGTGTVGGLTFAGTQIASDDSSTISFQDSIEIANGPTISTAAITSDSTFDISNFNTRINPTFQLQLGNSNTNTVLIGSGSNTVDFPSGTAVDFTGATVTGLSSNSLEAVAVGAGVADGNDLTITGGDATEINSTGGDANITGGSGALASGNVNIGTTQTVAVSIGASGVGTSIGGTLTANGNAIFNTGVQEKFATLTGSTGVTAMDCDNGQVFYLTGAAGDITANFTNLGLLAEYGTNVTVIINQGATPYEVTAVQIGGSAQTINWQGGSAPTGNANGIDSFSFTILRDGGSYVVLGQMVDFT